jgi:hypothetical protein
MMTRSAFSLLVLSLVAVPPCAGDDLKHQHKPSGTNPRLEQFKQLAGVWEGKEVEGRAGTDVKVEYRVTSGGSAVVERLMPNTDMEMVSIIHSDGEDLVMTHYCMLGNQPRMKSAKTGDEKQVPFKFADATNLKSANDMHMHDVTYTFPDKDTLRSEWVHYADGKPSGRVVFELKRKKTAAE